MSTDKSDTISSDASCINNTAPQHLELKWINSAVGGNTVFSVTISSSYRAFAVLEFSGQAATPFDVCLTTNYSLPNISVGPITTSGSDELLVGAAGNNCNNMTVSGVTSGYVLRQMPGFTTLFADIWSNPNSNSAGSFSFGMTTSGSCGGGNALIAAFKPLSSPPSASAHGSQVF